MDSQERANEFCRRLGGTGLKAINVDGTKRNGRTDRVTGLPDMSYQPDLSKPKPPAKRKGR